MKKIWRALCLLFIIDMLIIGCATDNTPIPNPISNKINPNNIKFLWQNSDLSDSYPGSFIPIMDQENAIFTVDMDGKFEKMDSTDGEIIEQFNINRKLSSGVAINSDSIFATTMDDYLISVNKVSHKIIWETKIPTLSIEAPQVGMDVVVVRTNDASLLGYSATNGTLLWVYQKPIPTLTLRATNTFQITSSGDVVVYGRPGGALSILNMQTGVSIWETIFASPVGSTDLDKLTDINMRPVINVDKTICLGTFNGRIGCIDAITSNKIWSNTFSTSTQIINNDVYLYAISQDGVLYAFDKKNGNQIWKNDTLQYRTLSGLSFLENDILLVDDDGFITTFNAQDGILISRTKSDLKGGISYPIVNNYKIIMQSANGVIAAITHN